MSPPRERERRFVNHLVQLTDPGREDRAALAALRRGLGKPPGEAAEMHPYVVPFLPRDGGRWEEDAHYLVAALFAWHQGVWADSGAEWDRNFGASFARLAEAEWSESGSIEKRFVALLNSHRDDLPEHLRHAIGLLRAHEVPVDWAQLLRDIQEWDRGSRSTQRGWACAFWGRLPPEDEAAEAGKEGSEVVGA